MKFEELTRRLVEEGLEKYVTVGTLYGSYNSTNIVKNDDGTFTVAFCDERGSAIRTFENIPEEEACQRVYKVASSKKYFDEQSEKKNNGMTL